MKKLFLVFCILMFACSPTFAINNRNYYIKKDKEYNTEFLCFSKDECYYAVPTILKIKHKKFVGFGAFHYYDLNTYKYDKLTDTYTIDVVVDRDPSTDGDVCRKCPFDNGNITHLIFSLTYSPSKRIFNAKYKGFISSMDVVTYKNHKSMYIKTKFLNIYYGKPQLIQDLQSWLDKYNNDTIKNFGTINSEEYDIEIMYLLKYYLKL